LAWERRDKIRETSARCEAAGPCGRAGPRRPCPPGRMTSSTRAHTRAPHTSSVRGTTTRPPHAQASEATTQLDRARRTHARTHEMSTVVSRAGMTDRATSPSPRGKPRRGREAEAREKVRPSRARPPAGCSPAQSCLRLASAQDTPCRRVAVALLQGSTAGHSATSTAVQLAAAMTDTHTSPSPRLIGQA
jgi:hypothetical protein